jgi:hypothetical protein
MRRVTDSSGAVWQAEEESRYSVGSIGPDDQIPQRNLAVVVFNGPGGRTVSASLGAGRLESIAEDDLRKILAEALAQQQKPVRGTPATSNDDEGLHGLSDAPGG